VACNTYRKLCNGWNAYWALQYYIDKDAQNNNPPGAVVESDMPYNEFNFVCTTVQNHPLKIASRHHVIDNYTDGDSLAHVFDIKSALRIHGPIAVGVCGSGAFQLYSGGVFNANNCQNPNHQVLLVGWDDKTESWILKNSWGTDWGENGYMRIKWGTNRVGFEPIYVVAP